MSCTFFTSESVSEGHPDKIADQISDAILDAILMQDENARVAAETLITRGLVVLAGEISTDAHVNYSEIVRETIKLAGYDHSSLGIDYQGCGVIVLYEKQSLDISSSVHHGKGREELEHMGAGDQGIMFGYATNETSGYMPLPILLAHRLMQRQAHLRKDGRLLWLGPDAKSQVTVAYQEGRPVQVTNVLISTQHSPDISNKEISEAVIEEIIKPCLTEKWLNDGVKFLVNPSGRFVSGGPHSDCGLTGRKIVVDTYGGFAPHGGGAFSGKDPSKVDRSATYMARYIAKNLVASGLVERCLIQLSYVIGQPNPSSIMVDSFGTSLLSEEQLIILIKKYFDLSVPGIIRSLDLLRPIYKKTSVYGHFGRDEPEFSWEVLDKALQLKDHL